MPSCSAADVQTALMATMPAPGSARPVARDQCPNEKYCDEVEHGRPVCPPTRCRFGGREHDKVPCPDHDRPFGVEAGHAETPAGPSASKPRRKKPTRKPARKPARRKTAGKAARAARRTSKPRKARRTSKAKKK